MIGAPQFFKSLAFRLTIYYAIVLVFALTIVYIVSSFLVSSLESKRVDIYLATQANECRNLFLQKGLAAVSERASEETVAAGTEDVMFRVYDAQAKTLFQTETTRFDAKHARLSQALTMGKPAEREFQYVNTPHDAPARIITEPLDSTHWLAIAVSMSDDLKLINDSMRLILIVMLATGLGGVVLGYILSRNALRGILLVQRAAVDIAGGKVDRRAPVVHRGDEVERLALAFNVMATRVEALLTQLRDANDQLAHELRSPLTHIRGRCELALMRHGQPQTLQAVAGETVEACDRLLRTINTILELSETESGMTALPREGVRLDHLLQNACELFMPLAQDAGIALVVDAPPATVMGAGAKLQRLFANLLDNAIKYTPRGGRVSMSLRAVDGRAEVLVRDTGRGIEPTDLPQVFDRFFRGQGNQGIAGNGLGLPLARSIARAHGGDITVASTPGSGTEFKVVLPLHGEHD